MREDSRYSALVAVAPDYGWTLDELQEALRQEWEIFYGRRHVGGLGPYERTAQYPADRVLVLHRRVAKRRRNR